VVPGGKPKGRMTYSLGQPTARANWRLPRPPRSGGQLAAARQQLNKTTADLHLDHDNPTVDRSPRLVPPSICAMGSRKRVKPNPAADSSTTTPTPTSSTMPSQSSSKSSNSTTSAADHATPAANTPTAPRTSKGGGGGDGTPTAGQGSKQVCASPAAWPSYQAPQMRRNLDAN